MDLSLSGFKRPKASKGRVSISFVKWRQCTLLAGLENAWVWVGISEYFLIFTALRYAQAQSLLSSGVCPSVLPSVSVSHVGRLYPYG